MSRKKKKRFVRKEELPISNLVPTGELSLVEIKQENNRLISWMQRIKKTDLLSRDWALQVIGELALQCAGKALVPSRNGYTTIYLPNQALRAIKLGAEISGALGNINNGNGANINFFSGGVQEKKDVQIPCSPDRTQEVFTILNRNGGFGCKSQELEYVDAEVCS